MSKLNIQIVTKKTTILGKAGKGRPPKNPRKDEKDGQDAGSSTKTAKQKGRLSRTDYCLSTNTKRSVIIVKD